MRTDLLELTPAILTELANAGLVKRAQREVEQGQFNEPTLEDDDGQVVTVTTADGNTVVFGSGSGLNGTCTCGAASCRHRIGAVLRYQQWHGAVSAMGPRFGGLGEPVSPAQGEPGEPGVASAAIDEETSQLGDLPNVTDENLAAALAPRTIATAKRRFTDGYLATVVRPDDEEPCIVELGSVSVRFLLGADLRYARCNCKLRTGCEHVALAAWAIQQARSMNSEHATIITTVGGPVGFGSATINDELSGLSVHEAVRQLVELVLTDGLSHLSPAFAVRVAGVRRLAERTRQQWIVVLLDRLIDTQISLEQRASVDVGRIGGDILAGFIARYRAAEASDTKRAEYVGPPAAIVLGTDERAETALAQIRFTGAGARVRPGPTPGSCAVDILLVDPTTSMFVFCRRLFRPVDPTAGGTVPTIGAGPELVTQTGPQVSNRTVVKGASVRTMAIGAVISNAVVRRADRTIDFRTGGLRQTSVMSGGASATRFHDAGIIAEPSAVSALRTEQPPMLLAPLTETYGIAAFEIEQCMHTFFDPAEQAVIVRARTVGGEELSIRSTYRDLSPGAPAALAQFASTDGRGTVIGHVRVEQGEVWVEPTLLGVIREEDELVMVPDLFDPDPPSREALASLELGRVDHVESELHSVIAIARTAVDELAIRGLRNVGGLDRDLDAAAQGLNRVGLTAMGQHLTALATAIRSASVVSTGSTVVTAWADAAIALRVASEIS
jgi:hypothetical protein